MYVRACERKFYSERYESAGEKMQDVGNVGVWVGVKGGVVPGNEVVRHHPHGKT